jgi:trimeric autotransporter adhesin
MKTHLKIFTTALFVLACCAFLPQLQAATDTPDPSGTCVFCTADGDSALFNGGGTIGNSAFGWFTQFANSTGNGNTSVGAAALELNGFDRNTAVGTAALFLSQGSDNTAVGTGALENNNTNGSTAVGSFALFGNQAAFGNTAVGQNALLFNDIDNMGVANGNTAVGNAALVFNTDGARNTAIGFVALGLNDGGNENTAVGFGALVANVAGNDNTAVGFNALNANTGGSNVAVGERAAESNTLGAVNTAVGSLALRLNTTGTENTAVGRHCLENLDGGHENTAVGWGAGLNYNGTEINNICIGDQTAGVAGESDTIRIGEHGVFSSSNGIVVKPQQAGGPPVTNTILIGTGNHSQGISVTELLGIGTIQIGRGLANAGTSTCFIGGIVGNAQPIAGTVLDVSIETAAGPNFQRLGVSASSRRFKDDIKPMNELSEAIYKLKPVTYRVKKDINPAQPIAFGLVAEDVAEACPDLAAIVDGQPFSVHYQEVNVMLLNEFLKEHKKVEEQQASIADLKSTVALQQKEMQVLTAQLKEQAAQIQKVSAQLEASKPAPKVVANK